MTRHDDHGTLPRTRAVRHCTALQVARTASNRNHNFLLDDFALLSGNGRLVLVKERTIGRNGPEPVVEVEYRTEEPASGMWAPDGMRFQMSAERWLAMPPPGDL